MCGIEHNCFKVNAVKFLPALPWMLLTEGAPNSVNDAGRT